MIIKGEVVSGDKTGKKLGFPTANIKVQDSNIPLGVFVSKLKVLGQSYFGITHIGNRATLDESEIKVEVHIFDFKKDIYGEVIEVKLLDKIRDTKKFDSLELLKIQIAKDVKQSQAVLSSE